MNRGKYKVGDKFMIEVAQVIEGAESKHPHYRIKGFDSLMFDDRGLDKLVQAEMVTFTKNYHVGDRVQFFGVDALTNEDMGTWAREHVDNLHYLYKFAYGLKLVPRDRYKGIIKYIDADQILAYVEIVNPVQARTVCVGMPLVALIER